MASRSGKDERAALFRLVASKMETVQVGAKAVESSEQAAAPLHLTLDAQGQLPFSTEGDVLELEGATEAGATEGVAVTQGAATTTAAATTQAAASVGSLQLDFTEGKPVCFDCVIAVGATQHDVGFLTAARCIAACEGLTGLPRRAGGGHSRQLCPNRLPSGDALVKKENCEHPDEHLTEAESAAA